MFVVELPGVFQVTRGHSIPIEKGFFGLRRSRVARADRCSVRKLMKPFGELYRSPGPVSYWVLFGGGRVGGVKEVRRDAKEGLERARGGEAQR